MIGGLESRAEGGNGKKDAVEARERQSGDAGLRWGLLAIEGSGGEWTNGRSEEDY